MRYTKGPWHVQKNADVYTHIVRDPTGHRIIAQLGQDTTEEIRANTRLIAAAPEMLEALKYLSAWIKHTVPTWTDEVERGLDMADAAIRKAEDGR
jgi:hypothetical protein